jgi:hypothetical protein
VSVIRDSLQRIWHPEGNARAHRIVASLKRALLLSVVTCAIAVGVGASVRAEAEDRMLAFGAGLAEVERLIPELAGERTLVVNGARLVMLSGATEEPVSAVLDRLAIYCAPRIRRGDDGGGGGPEVLFRAGDNARGFVTCFDGLVGLRPRELLAAFRAMAGGDFTAAGDPRYFYAERRGDTTFYLAVTLEGGLDIDLIFPREGDAPGPDVPGIERPRGSRRILSAHLEGRPHQVLLYAGAGATPAELLADYRVRLDRRGWRILEPRGAAAPGEEVLFAERGGRMVALVFAEDKDGTSMMVLTGL